MSQLPDRPLQAQCQDEGEYSKQRKRPRIDQPWLGHFQPDARALVILLQVGSLEPDGSEVTFQGCFEGPNIEQYFGFCPMEGSRGHNKWLDGPVQLLTRNQRAAYVVDTVRRVLDFL